jgi:signal transduction histidine kinase
MGKGGMIEVSTGPSRERFGGHGKTRRMAIVSVSDTGRGMSEEELRKIFIPYYTRKKTGIGIGLTLSKKIIKDHGGIIKVKSQKGKGTTFSLYLPFGDNA